MILKMCGIAAIVSGVTINSSSSSSSSSSSPLTLCVDDLEEALRRRGPDTFGTSKVYLHQNGGGAQLDLFGATLQLRGTTPITQPLVDSSGNHLLFNGEIFGGGVHVPTHSNDAQLLLLALQLQTTSCCISLPHLLSTILGPWALIYWHQTTQTLWFGRDAFGRRSLLVHWPTVHDPRLILTSVSPDSPAPVSSDFEVENECGDGNFWEELACGVYSLSIKSDECLSAEIKRHEWANPQLNELLKWEREFIEPKPEDMCTLHSDIHSECVHKPSFDSPVLTPAERVRRVLKESVMRRTTMTMQDRICDSNRAVPIAVLFSGGLDSMILAALLDECLEAKYEIDLLNVSFDGRSAPDRISARAGVKELERISPLRRWRLVEIDAELSKLTLELKHVMSLINPAKTYMDLNIGIALWLAAGGDGWVNKMSNHNEGDDDSQRVRYKSEARILLVGSGADEQCGGYGRHRTRFKAGSWLGLHKEMKLDMQRIWKRNLGRDDRCLSDNGKEARFPFLDEDVIKTLLDIPLWDVVDLNQPSGCGDKKILREVAQLLGLNEAARLPKRAIQFGSRIARESNRKNYGSNRAANQASAGSAKIHQVESGV